MSRPPDRVPARLLIDGESVEVEVWFESATIAQLRQALRLAKAKRQRDLDRIVQAALARNPEATLDELCKLARRKRSEVSAARTRARAALDTGSAGSSLVSAVPCPENGTSDCEAEVPEA